VPGVEGFYVVTGCCVGGLSTSPAIGETMAAWIADGRPPMDLSSFGLRRFGPEPPADERLRAACTWQYGHFYSDGRMPENLIIDGRA
jgi:4-methylaminobutanoate oxidase (formaldehyde-forming)